MSYNEESGRYKVLEPVFYLPPRDRPMFKVDGWKPGRPKFLPILNQVGEAAYKRLCLNLKTSYQLAYNCYEENLGLGIDPGLARDCLPVGIYSSCWVTCNPRSLMSFLSLRTHEPDSKYVSYPLYEIEVAAKQVETIFAEGWPLTYRVFNECGRVSP
jgi:thymidylate synthase (FAD)